MKKISAISLIAIGTLLLAFSIFLIIDNTITLARIDHMEYVMARLRFQQMLNHSRNGAYIMSVISTIVVFVGLKLKAASGRATANL